jgi:hypothetical protein
MAWRREMSFVTAVPEMVTDAATSLANIGSTISTANAAAAAPTTGVLAAAGDEVSSAIATVFSQQASAFQALSAQGAAFHQQFVQAVGAAAGSYAAAEAANASLLGRPLIGNGAGLAAAAATPAAFADGPIGLGSQALAGAETFFNLAGESLSKAFQNLSAIQKQIANLISSGNFGNLGSYLNSILSNLVGVITNTVTGLTFGIVGIGFGAASLAIGFTLVPAALIVDAVIRGSL